ncbi:SDR family oxidoreductase [Portibacter marinus]|uniref:SDR family oxidoreductase n=1 Tax=Portibacter marinus TaxID=2898660 RepID=UPI001F27BB8A|nr:NmrA family NAD(P)-binding protein [Portibacter marinus]
MSLILITGATGNVGSAVLDHLLSERQDFRILAGVRDVKKDSEILPANVEAVPFDFEDQHSIKAALEKTEILFLLRPPQLADVNKYFDPVISMALEEQIQHIVFLSVQGAEKSKFIPYHKIEKLIINSSLPYTFLRPAYFMQNFTTIKS